jgi:hypothetical protein
MVYHNSMEMLKETEQCENERKTVEISNRWGLI